VDDLLTDFISETRETLDAIAGEIVAWEADPTDRTRLDAIFRFVHTVKGSCGFLDLPRLQRLSHAAEDVLADLRSGNRTADAALVTAVLAVIDRIGELTDAIESGEPLSDEGEHGLIAALAANASAPSAPVQPVPQAALPTRSVSRSIRLPVELLDRMMASVSDMVLARNDLAQRLREIEPSGPLNAAFERLSHCVGDMREAITRSRMARIDTLFALLPRMVRDLASELGRKAVLEVDGGDVELDRELIEMIRDPLVHLVRNALDHGIELPEARRAAGKAETGLLRIVARQAGNQILIEVQDDGRGIDPDRVLQRAMAAGLVQAEQASGMSRARKLELVFLPGLSTAASVTSISGRGVGMDVVRANLERIGGTVDIESRIGHGVRLTLRVPLTLTIIPALTVSSAGSYFAIPRSVIEGIVRAGGCAARIERIGGALAVTLRGAHLPVLDLGRFMGLADEPAAPQLLVVLRTGAGDRFALAVDAVHDHQELVVKPASPLLMASGIYAGTTLPDNSRPMLLLDVAGIAAAAGVHTAVQIQEPAEEPEERAILLPSLLFRDLDGATRAVRLPLVERIYDVPVEGVVAAGGARLLAHKGRVSTLHAAGPLPTEGTIRVLRLSDGAAMLHYAIDEVIDIVDLEAALAPVPVAGPIAGVALHQDLPVEVLDAHWLFASAVRTDAEQARPLCLVADADDPWAREVLTPLLDMAGYRVSFASEAPEGRVAVIVASGETPAGVEAPVIRLRSGPERERPDDDSIYRYDRDGLLRALQARVAAGG